MKRIRVPVVLVAGYFAVRAGFQAVYRIGVHRKGLRFRDEIVTAVEDAQRDLAGEE